MAATRKVRQGNVSSEPPASRGTEFPSFALPLILSRLASRGRSPDLLTLLAVCCVSREWKDAAEGDPELWREIDIPDCLHKKLTDERLISIVKRSKGRGLTLVDLNRCTNLTDNSVKAIQQNLPQLPQAVHLSYCTKVTWRSVIPLAKHILKQLNERERDRKNPEKHITTPWWGMSLTYVNWKGCPAYLFKECFVDTPLEDEIHEVQACDDCGVVENLANCIFCHCYQYGSCKKTVQRCACCKTKGCPEHFDNTPVFDCDHQMTSFCVRRPENKRLFCSQCEHALCPKCDTKKMYTHPGCLNCGKTICNRCRYEDTICECKYGGLSLVRFNRMQFPAFCPPCLSMVYGNPRHKLREKKRKTSIDWELDEAEPGRDRPDPALRFCLTCGKVRTYCEDFQTDESSGREDARSQGDTDDSDDDEDTTTNYTINYVGCSHGN